METQNQMILSHLRTGKCITPLEALKLYGCFRLSGRIYDLKQDGWHIDCTIVTKGKKRWGSYFLNNPDQLKKEWLGNKGLRLL